LTVSRCRGEFGGDYGGQRGGPVFVALAGADDDLVAGEVDVLHSESGAFQQA